MGKISLNFPVAHRTSIGGPFGIDYTHISGYASRSEFGVDHMIGTGEDDPSKLALTPLGIVSKIHAHFLLEMLSVRAEIPLVIIDIIIFFLYG